MAQDTEKRGRGRLAADVCPPEWLAHLRAWCDEHGAADLQRYHTVPWGKYETLLGMPAGKVGRWYKQQPAGGKTSQPQQLTRTEYFELCPLLAGWHAYEPPTVEWQIL